jgi:hypothetical protein
VEGKSTGKGNSLNEIIRQEFRSKAKALNFIQRLCAVIELFLLPLLIRQKISFMRRRWRTKKSSAKANQRDFSKFMNFIAFGDGKLDSFKVVIS